MTVITVERLEKAKRLIECGLNCNSVSIEGGLQVTPEAVDWLKENHYQVKIVETFGPTGIAAAIYPASAE